jgi:Family of unknown function (DUF6534)
VFFYSGLSLKVNCKVIRVTIETGTMTALAAVIALVFYISQHNGLHQVSGVILGKLYTNTLLALFNNRLLVNKDLYGSEVVLLSGNLGVHSSSVQHQTTHDRGITVTIDMETSSGAQL